MLKALLAFAGVAVAASTAASKAFINVNRTNVYNLDWVRVTFGGLTVDEAKVAWIGLYSPASTADVSRISALPYPATAPWTASAPVKFITLAEMGTDANETGSGSWDFELINMYEDVQFYLFKEDITSPTSAASSQVISFASTPPLRGHLTPTADNSAVAVTWNTATDGGDSVVQYGTSSGAPYPNSAPAVTTTYTASDLCGPPANGQGWFPPHVWNTAVMTDLSPATTIYYRYGSASGGWSDEYSFTSAPVTGPDTPVSILAYADMGMAELDGSEDHWANPEAWETVQGMITTVAQDSSFTLGLHVGDVSYATGNEAKWYLFDERTSLLARSVPMAIGHGNHERDFPGTGTSSFYSTSVDSGGECGVATVARYPTPAAPSGAAPLQSSWYNITHGSVTIIMLNSELPVESTSKQYAFLEASLSAVDRSVTPWVFVAFHRPLYYNGITRDPNFAQFEDLLYQYQVDLVLNGHVHYAQAYCPTYQSACVTATEAGAYDAPIYAIIGNAGMDLTALGSTSPILKWQDSVYGFSTIVVSDATQLKMTFFADGSGDELYSFNIARSAPRVQTLGGRHLSKRAQ